MGLIKRFLLALAVWVVVYLVVLIAGMLIAAIPLAGPIAVGTLLKAIAWMVALLAAVWYFAFGYQTFPFWS